MTVPLRHAPAILIAEDNDSVRAALGGLLRLAGHHADLVCNGLEALEAAAVRDYDIVILDSQMPYMSGPEAATRLRHNSATPRIVGLSAEPWPSGDGVSALDEFLAKPVRLHDLVRVLSPPRP